MDRLRVKTPLWFLCALSIVVATAGCRRRRRREQAPAETRAATAVNVEPKAPDTVAAVPKTATKETSGLAYEVLQAGDGKGHPTLEHVVVVHYNGWTSNGQLFETTRGFGEPKAFLLKRTMLGWQQGIAQMSKGERRRYWIPDTLAYNKRGGQPGGTIVFDLELIDFREPEATPKAPAHFSPPEDAKRLKSGVAYRVIHAGKGGKRLKATQVVAVRFTGWNKAGDVIDSTEDVDDTVRLVPASIMAAWAEVIPLCAPGEKIRLWTAEKDTYQRDAVVANGPLIFDIEILPPERN